MAEATWCKPRLFGILCDLLSFHPCSNKRSFLRGTPERVGTENFCSTVRLLCMAFETTVAVAMTTARHCRKSPTCPRRSRWPWWATPAVLLQVQTQFAKLKGQSGDEITPVQVCACVCV